MKLRLLALMLLAPLLLTACGERDGTYDEFAQCLADQEVELYGAFWCPNCEEQREDFGDSAELLPYIECAEGGEDPQVQRCLDEGITRYPTWRFSDGSELIGRQSFEALAEASSCALPGEQQSILFE